MSLTELEQFKVKDELRQDDFRNRLVKNLPTDVEQFFELSKFDLDVTQ